MALQVQKLLKSAKLINSTRAFTTGTFDKGLNENASKKMHIAVQRDYPTAKQLPLPPNIDIAETARFSPLRNRDITASALIVHQELIDVTLDQKPDTQRAEPIMDPHLEIYDRQGSVNLSSVMQSTVPEPYGGNHSFSHLNMPGSQWCIQVKYLSHELNSAHYTQLRQEVRSDWSHYSTQPYKGINSGTILNARLPNSCSDKSKSFLIINKRFLSLSSQNHNAPKQETKALSGREKLKKAVKEYGSTVVVFHVGISLMSLGMSYVLVSSGLDVMAILDKFDLTDKLPAIASNASTFVIAYALHKVFAPVRITITITSTPFIVKYLRNKGILKK